MASLNNSRDMTEYFRANKKIDHVLQFSHHRSGMNWLSAILRNLFGYPSLYLERTPITDETWQSPCFIHSHLYSETEFFSHVKTIFLVRDPRDVMRSLAGHLERLNCKEDRPRPFDPERMKVKLVKNIEWIEKSACRWNDYFVSGVREPENNVLQIQYERLCLYPMRTMCKIIKYLGLPILKTPQEIVTSRDRPKDFPEPDWDYYNAHCLHWQRDEELIDDWNNIICNVCSEWMEMYNYTKDGHAEELLKP